MSSANVVTIVEILPDAILVPLSELFVRRTLLRGVIVSELARIIFEENK